MNKPRPDTVFFLFCIAILGLAPIVSGMPAAYNLDFFPVYGQVLGMWNGIPFYHEEQLYDWLAVVFSFNRAGAEVAPLAQPPWYYVSLFFLGWFDVRHAAQVWFSCNLMMLVASAVLFTARWKLHKRALACIAICCFPPCVGLLVVGQFTLPVLLGVALLVRSVFVESAWGIGVGLALLTFKPHVGILVAIAALFWLLLQRSAYARQGILRSIIVLLFLVGLSLVVDASWPYSYLDALQRVGGRPDNIRCDTCIGFLPWLSGMLRWSLQTRWLVGAGLFLASALFLFFLAVRWRNQKEGLFMLCGLGSLIGLFINPYIRNYDLVMAMVGFFTVEEISKSRSLRCANGAVFLATFMLFFNQARGAFHNILWILPLVQITMIFLAREGTCEK